MFKQCYSTTYAAVVFVGSYDGDIGQIFNGLAEHFFIAFENIRIIEEPELLVNARNHQRRNWDANLLKG